MVQIDDGGMCCYGIYIEKNAYRRYIQDSEQLHSGQVAYRHASVHLKGVLCHHSAWHCLKSIAKLTEGACIRSDGSNKMSSMRQQS